MNVLSISCKKGWGGVVTFVYRCALGLAERGHRVWLLSHPDSTFNRSNPPGVEVLPKRLGMDYNPVMIAYLTYFIKRERVDVVVTNIKKEVITGGIAARLAGVPNVRMIGSPDDLNDSARWYQQRLVDHSVLPSDATLREAAARVGWLEPEKFTTVYAGRNPAAYSAEELKAQRSHWGVSDGGLVVGSTCQIAAVKGLDRLISVFKEALEKHPNCWLVLTGEGPETARLKSLSSTLGIADRVVFAGFSTDPMRASAAYDIAVLNSTSEGFPNSVVEYFAAARPVICTNVGGIPEMVKAGENGLLIPPGDDRALLDGIVGLLGNPERRDELGRNALATLKRGFTEGIMVDSFERVLKDVTARRIR
jgi:glycosyltransferase involved in cell wall biosynthesis